MPSYSTESHTDLNDDSISPELYFLIAHFLNNSPFSEIAKKLIEQLEAHNIFPKRIDWRGREHTRNFSEIIEFNSGIPSNFLLQMCNQLRILFDQNHQNGFSNMRTLMGTGQFSVLHDMKRAEQMKGELRRSNLNSIPKGLYANFSVNDRNSSINNGCKLCSAYNYDKRSLNGNINLLLNITKREIDGRLNTLNIVQPDLYKGINIHKRIFGHLASIYCVLYDRTGRFIFTGADDNLIKAWCTSDGRLMATFRGHEKEISDLDLSYENTLLASGSCDKTLRIWNLKTTETMSVLHSHNSSITAIEFSPYCLNDDRWLVSAGADSTVCFWKYNVKTLQFQLKPVKFIEKSRAGTQVLCLSFSAGGLMLATGSSDHMIRIYGIENHVPSKIFELETHKNIVDSIQYSNNSLRFVSGSKDGSALIWKYEACKWNVVRIDATKTLTNRFNESNEISLNDCKKNNVSMVTWNCDDSLIITAQGNYYVKVWNSNTGGLIHELKGHESDVFVLEAHPKDPRLVLSAGNEGFLFLWNVLTGKMLKKFVNKSANEDPGWIFDTKWSPTMDMFASTDSSGHLVIFGFGSDENYRKTPIEQFFHTDYRPLMRGENNYVLDEQTQQPPHLMPPPYLVDADGNPYPAEYQRLVPGRDQLSEALLTPQVIINERGIPEIIIENNEPAAAVAENAANPEEPSSSSSNGNDEQNHTINRRRNNLWVKDFIRPLDPVLHKTCQENRLSKLKQEEEYYYRNLTIKSSHGSKATSRINHGMLKSASSYNINEDSSSSRRRGTRPRRGENENDNNQCIDRLNAKALYDTDNEEEIMNEVEWEYTDETTRDQFIAVDEDSNTNLSVGGDNSQVFPNDEATNMSSATNTNTNTNNNNIIINNNRINSTNNLTATGRVTWSTREGSSVDPMDVSDNDSSDYSDWAQQEGRSNLRPPPTRSNRKKTRSKRPSRQTSTRRTNRIQDEDGDGENEPTTTTNNNRSLNESTDSRIGRNLRSKRSKRILSDDDGDEEESDNYNNSKRNANSHVDNKKQQSSNKQQSTRQTLKRYNRTNNDGDEKIGGSRNLRSKNVKRIMSDDEDDDDESNEELNENHTGGGSDGSLCNTDDDDEDDEDEDCTDKPCTSSAAATSSRRGRKSKSSKKLSRSKQVISQSSKSISKSASSSSNPISSSKMNNKSNSNNLSKRSTECPAEYRPPEWLTSTKPKKSPYVPQIGDEVVYFRQGHELYVEAVKKFKVYEIDESSLPWNKNKNNIGVQEFCKVTGLKIEIKPPRLVCLKLAIIDSSNERCSNLSSFTIKYHDMNDVIDFVVLRQFYDKALSRDWRPKDRFRSIIDDQWWFGQVEAKRPLQEEYPDSQFQCLKIIWDNGEPEEMSPWDLEPISGGAHARKSKAVSSSAVPTNPFDSLAITNEEMKSLLYEPVESEWPGEGRDAECERILNGLKKIMDLSIAERFNSPVDLDEYPMYAMSISYPIDLNTIRERLENRYYRRLNSIQFDIRYIQTNAIKFNEKNSDIVKLATQLTELLLEFVGDPHCTNPMPIYKRLCDSHKLNVNNNNSHNSSHSAAENDNNQQRLIRHRPIKNSKLPMPINSGNGHQDILNSTSKTYAKRKTYTLDGWLNDCQKLIRELLNDKDSEPFREPVDIISYPDYITIVKRPIDLSTIDDRLKNDYYESLKDFDADCKLLFHNSRLYNTNKRSEIYIITSRLNNRYESKIKKIFEAHKTAALKQKDLITSRYGRKIKARYDEKVIKMASMDRSLNASELDNYYPLHRGSRRSTRNSGANPYYSPDQQNNQLGSIAESKTTAITTPIKTRRIIDDDSSSSTSYSSDHHSVASDDDNDDDNYEKEKEEKTTRTKASKSASNHDINRSFLNNYDNEDANHATTSKRANSLGGSTDNSTISNESKISNKDYEEPTLNLTRLNAATFDFSGIQDLSSLDADANNDQDTDNKTNQSLSNKSGGGGGNESLTLNAIIQQSTNRNLPIKGTRSKRVSNGGCDGGVSDTTATTAAAAATTATAGNSAKLRDKNAPLSSKSNENSSSSKINLKRKRKASKKSKKKSKKNKKASSSAKWYSESDDEDDDDLEAEDDDGDEDYENEEDDHDEDYDDSDNNSNNAF